MNDEGETVSLSETEELLLDIFRTIRKYWKYEACFIIGLILGWLVL